MTPIAAYYVMVITDLEREARAAHDRYAVIVPKRSILERIAAALESLVGFGRPTTTQPI
jgi:hypothetical protein